MRIQSFRTVVLLGALIGASPLLVITRAVAQDVDPEEGGVYLPPEDPETPPEAPPSDNRPRAWYEGGPTGARPTQRTDGAEPTGTDSEDAGEEPSDSGDPESGESDHHRMVGRVAVGFMGSSVVPIGILDPTAGIASQAVTAPALGIRYWFTDLVGLDVGIGLGVLTGSVESGAMSIPTNDSFALVFHAGVPIAIYHTSHYAFLIIPEINIGYASGTIYGGTMDEDRGREGVLFQLGGRLGTEINFGFMDIPQLSLQASVGIYLDYSGVSVGPNRAGSVEGIARNTFAFGTTVMGEPWDILLGALTALYYF